MTGSTEQSYGIEVAGLAGLPSEITDRAREILKTLEKNEVFEFKELKKEKKNDVQLALFPLTNQTILDELQKIDLVSVTPLQALNRLYEWQQKLRKENP